MPAGRGGAPGRSPRAATVIAIFGPTGVGKTAVAIALAELARDQGHDPLAISADALQLYAGLEILTGAPTAEEQACLEHRLVGTVPVTETFSVGEFMPRAHAEVDAALSHGRLPIVVGGTGLYLRAALTDLALAPPPAPGVRERLERRLEREGVSALHAELSRRSPEAAGAIATTDRARVVRALELLEGRTGPYRERVTDGDAEASGESQLWSAGTRHPTLLAGLVMARRELYAAIDSRVEEMVAAGAVEEVHRAQAAGASATARKALGYRELLAGDVEGMKRRTRNYAKRQLTWMRKLAGVEPIDLTGRSPLEAARRIAQLAGLAS